MTSFLQHLTLFSELGEKHSFSLRDGRTCLGWIDEVLASSIRFIPAPSPFDEGDHNSEEYFFLTLEIEVDLIQRDSLAFYDGARREWVDYEAAGSDLCEG